MTRADSLPLDTIDVIIKSTKDARAYEKSEDPLYVLENNVPIDTKYYLDQQLSKPLMRIFEPILGEKASSLRERPFFSFASHAVVVVVVPPKKKLELIVSSRVVVATVAGDHTRTVSIVAPTVGGLMKFAVKTVTCLGCRTPLKPNSLSAFDLSPCTLYPTPTFPLLYLCNTPITSGASD